VGCRRVPGPPYLHAFGLDGRAPHLLHASREILVPLAITNTGTRMWDPARVHVSYHWLWFIPRELAARSRWDIPYHDGIRTELAEPVAPGARVAVEVRLLVPSVPGLYWLQWDMVEEGVTWFAQASPRQPRELVVVLPALADVFAPLPLLTAIAGIAALRVLKTKAHRPTPAVVAFVAAADLVWCAATLFAKPLLLAQDALLEPTPVAYWLMIVAAVAPPLVLMLVLPRRARVWALLACGVCGSLVILGDLIYYRFFGDVISAPALLAVGQTAHVVGSIRSLLTPGLLWVVVDLPFAVWLVAALQRLSPAEWIPGRAQPVVVLAALGTTVALAIAGIVLAAPTVLASSHLSQMFRNRTVVEEIGPFAFHAYDGWAYARATLLRAPATEAQVEDVREWFRDRAGLRAGAGPSFGAARARNLVVVQVESLQDFAVDYSVGGQEVMPHLRRWTDDSLRFTNVTDQTNEGRTSDAEFAALVSLLPLDHGAVAFRYPGNHYVGLPRVLAEHGYATLSAVPFEPGFWNRRVMHRSYGFDRSLFEPDFELTDQIGWGLNDHAFLQQMVPRLSNLPQPFCAWLITLSLHHPFDDFPDRHKTLKLGEREGTAFGNYLHTMRFFDQALDDFKTALARNGLLDDTLLVVFGDHDAGFQRDAAKDDEAGWALKDRVPLFVRVPAASPESLRGPRAVTAGHTDVAPTLLALLGIDPAPLPYVGRNLLGAPGDPPLLRPFGDWMDATRLYLSHTAEHTRACYDLASRAFTHVGACDEADVHARKARDVSRFVIANDLQERLYVPAAGTRK
jgi:phosphoglycerol transferase MdoB-like AlkP superfamily enzyme